MDREFLIKKATSIFQGHADVKLAYLFGSVATGNTGPLSDYDFAVYLDTRNAARISQIKAALFNELSQALTTDHLDIVILDAAESPELKYAIIKDGVLLLARGDFKVMVEPRILNEYFDFMHLLRRHHLTRA